MSNWMEFKISKVTESFAGGTPSRSIPAFYGGDIPWVKSTEVNQAAVWSTTESLTALGFKMSNCKLAPKKSVLIAMYGATAGQVSMLNIEASTNQAVLAIVCQSDLNAEFLYYSLINAKEKILYLAQGSGQPNLSKQLIDKTKINLPPLPQQKKIAHILTTVDNLIEQTQALIDKYTAIKQGMMADLFTRGIDLSGTPETNPNHGQLRPSYEDAPELYKETVLGWVPKEWDVCSLSSLVNGNRCPSGIYKEKIDYGSGCYILKISEVFGYDKYRGEDIQRVPLSLREYEANKVEREDILIAIASVKLEGVGKVMLVDSLAEDTAYDHNVSLIRTNKNNLASFVFHYMKSDQIRSQIRRKCTQVGTIFLKSSSINSFHFPVINMKEQIAITTPINSIEESIDKEKIVLEKYKIMKNGLMQDLLTGKVRVNA